MMTTTRLAAIVAAVTQSAVAGFSQPAPGLSMQPIQPRALALTMQRRHQPNYSRDADCAAPIDVDLVERLIGERTDYRWAKDYRKADVILSRLSSLGVVVDDDERTWCVRSWQRPNGNRREQSARRAREHAAKTRRGAKPTQPNSSRASDAAYQRSTTCAAPLSDSEVRTIADTVADRLAARRARKYKDADALLAQLGEAGVCVSDERREWRADGATFTADYVRDTACSRLAANAATADRVAEVEGLVRQRAAAKAGRDYAAADALLERLLTLGVVVEDRRRAWRFVVPPDGRTRYGGFYDPGHDYVPLRRSDQRDAATGRAHLELDPRLLAEVDDLLRRRLDAKRAFRFDQADELQRILEALGVQTDERSGTWKVAFAYTASSWRVRE